MLVFFPHVIDEIVFCRKSIQELVYKHGNRAFAQGCQVYLYAWEQWEMSQKLRPDWRKNENLRSVGYSHWAAELRNF